MAEIDDLLEAARNRPRPSSRRALVALVVAGAATMVAIGTGATLAATAAVSLLEHEAESSAARDPGASIRPAAPAVDSDVDVVTSTPTVPSPEATPTATPLAPSEFGFPVYDASTDIATIPRPVDDSDPAHTEIWLTQQGIIADCMLEQGFDYVFTAYWLVPSDPAAQRAMIGLGNARPGTVEFEALYGVPEFGPDDPDVAPAYRWEDAGCVGYAVHVTGMDDAH
ncbi:hypothetical protein [Agromyces sp. M3QZ16-3]|uniref:hypothetical protein n=1 Tax=Agromyces sp. M3QZ16-3 TaxID=3447585 RepID=UPI003F694489